MSINPAKIVSEKITEVANNGTETVKTEMANLYEKLIKSPVAKPTSENNENLAYQFGRRDARDSNHRDLTNLSDVEVANYLAGFSEEEEKIREEKRREQIAKTVQRFAYGAGAVAGAVAVYWFANWIKKFAKPKKA